MTLCKIFSRRHLLFVVAATAVSIPRFSLLAATPPAVKAELARQSETIVAQMIESLAGDEHWRNVRFIRFDFTLVKGSHSTMWNQHLWDRASGDNRIEWRDDKNLQVVVLLNENTKSARAWVGEFEKSGDELKSIVADARRRHMYDVFWLGAPFMLADKRSNVKYEGTLNVDGQDYDLLHARFDPLGTLMGDHYWFYINRTTHLVDRWAYFLSTTKGTPSLRSAVAWRWRNWKNVGNGLVLSTERVRVDRDWKASFPVVQIMAEDEIPVGVFTDVNVSLPNHQPAPE